jgi:hypothetical protein
MHQSNNDNINRYGGLNEKSTFATSLETFLLLQVHELKD